MVLAFRVYDLCVSQCVSPKHLLMLQLLLLLLLLMMMMWRQSVFR